MSDEELLLAEDEAKWQSKQAKRLARERAEMQPVMLAGQHLQGRECPLPACLSQLSLQALDGLLSKDRSVSAPHRDMMLPGQAGLEVASSECICCGDARPTSSTQLSAQMRSGAMPLVSRCWGSRQIALCSMSP